MSDLAAGGTTDGSTRTVHHVDVIPHTHWDREWYSPFPTFRLRLVDLLDELLPRLESDPGFTHFQLDGQMAVVDDYLGLRPGAKDRLRHLASTGRLSMGPWYVLPDEFLVSGETHVRNLQRGLRRAEDFGGAMQVGYLPDMFGHIAQMPQILTQFGFADAVVWRGVPSSVHSPAFRWEAPDGSSVRAEYLPAGYGNGSGLPDDTAAVRRKIETFRLLFGDLVGDPILLMAGMDHEVPPPHLTSVVAALNAEEATREGGDVYELRICSLAEHLASSPRADLPVISGEMRSGHRANVLMGVASNRVDVKQAAARAERTLERIAEPLAALWLSDPDHGGDPQRWAPVFDLAWLDVIRNAAHDSICACSHDEVVDAVLHRYAEATRLAEGVADRAVAAAAARMAAAGATVLNATPRTRSGIVEIDLPGDGPDGAADDGSDAAVLQILSSVQATDELDGAVGADASRRVLAMTGEVPGYGWARWQPVAPDRPVAADGDLGLTNGLVTVVVDPTDATFSIDAIGGFGRLVDDGDSGDTYNWCPPEVDRVVDAPSAVRVTRTEVGPLRGRLVVEATYLLPERCTIDGRDDMTTGWAGGEIYRRVGEVPTVITTTIELRADDPAVRVTTAWDQRSRDHRLRVHLPVPTPTDHSEAEDAYAVIRRPLWIEGGPHEWGVPTFPSRRFVRAGGLTVPHEGLCEYELVDLATPRGRPVRAGSDELPYGVAPPRGTTASTLAVTLVRSTGWLSRGPMPSRPIPAGPFDRLDGSQVLRPLELCYALQLDATPGALDGHALADHVWNPLIPAVAAGGGDLGDRGTMLEITGLDPVPVEGPPRAPIALDAVLRDQDGRLVVRAHSTGDRPAVLAIPGTTGSLVDLRGEEIAEFDDSTEVAPHRIVTVRLDRSG